MFSKVNIIATENVIVLQYNGKRIQFRKDAKPSEFEVIKDIIRSGNEDELIKKAFKKGLYIPEYSKGLFSVDEDNNIIVEMSTNTPVSKALSKRIVLWAKDGLPFEPLLNFHKKCLKNPSKDSVEDLYGFLEKNLIAITQNGNFIAYKKVKKGSEPNTLVDCHTGKIKQVVGEHVSMKRSDVNPKRDETCSTGLHVCGFDYLSQFSGDTVLEVEVNPVDVVSVPTDYNATKMRVCSYYILGIGGELIQEAHINTEKYNEPDVIPTEEIEISDKPKKKKVEVEGEKKPKVKIDYNSTRWENMTAQDIKDYIFEAYGIKITLDNKNKKSIVNKADKIVAEELKK